MLDLIEARIVGSLIEKQLTTPQQYPLTLNGLTLACNQTSNRDPVLSVAESEVEAGLRGLKEQGLVRFVLPSHGRSVVRYRHVLDERLAFDQRQLALIGVLLLRGPQTIGELRTRTERMASFDGVEDVESDLEGLTRREESPVARLPRRPGQKEERWTQLLYPQDDDDLVSAPVSQATRSDSLSDLRDEVAALRDEVLELRLELEDLKSRSL